MTIGVSGGSTPAPVYTMLATDIMLPWQRLRCLLLDERYVPSDHADSNARMIRSTLLTRAGADATFVSPDTSLPLEAAVEQYDAVLSKEQRMDLAILGMGPDGHVASLFPPLDPAAFGPRSVIATTTDRFAVKDRIGVTLPVLEHAKKRVFLIAGKEKRNLLDTMQQDTQDASLFPASALLDDRTTWIVGP